MIRPLRPQDVEGFIECYIQVFKTLYEILPDEYVTKQIREASQKEYYHRVLGLLDDPSNILLISHQSREITGIAWGNVKGELGWLGFMGVKKLFRRRGIGRSLLNRFIEEVTTRGAAVLSLDTHPSLIPAIRLYESEGFKRKGMVENPYGLELILYSKKLS
jgi:ribosomal protein S18 acetylase RimI-like enzyme